MNRHQQMLSDFTLKPKDSERILGKAESIRADRVRAMRDKGLPVAEIVRLLFYIEDSEIAGLQEKERIERLDKRSPQNCAMPRSQVLQKRKAAATEWVQKCLREADDGK